MIKRVTSIDAYHNIYVQNKIDDIQEEGYTVTEVKRIEKMKLGIFGNDVTEIHYEPNYK